jgi:ligand-binding sensor domain-containing protein
LFMLDPDVGWKRYTKSNSGLIGNKIHCLLVDQEGHLWVGTDKGVSVLAIDSVPSTQGEWIPAH